MSFFNNISNFFQNDMKGFFDSGINKITHPIDTVKSVISDIYEVGSTITNPIENRVSSVVNTLHTDARQFVGGYNQTINKVIDRGGDFANEVVRTTGSTVSNVGQSFSWPLVLVGGAVAVMLIMKK